MVMMMSLLHYFFCLTMEWVGEAEEMVSGDNCIARP